MLSEVGQVRRTTAYARLCYQELTLFFINDVKKEGEAKYLPLKTARKITV